MVTHINKILKERRTRAFTEVLIVLKIYGIEQVHCSLTACDENIYTKWIWDIIQKISDLSIVHDYLLTFLFTDFYRLGGTTTIEVSLYYRIK